MTPNKNSPMKNNNITDGENALSFGICSPLLRIFKGLTKYARAWALLLAAVLAHGSASAAVDAAGRTIDPIQMPGASAVATGSGAKIRVFFLGNSFTAAAGSQPYLLKELLKSRGYVPDIYSYNRGGEFLGGFWLKNEGNELTVWERNQSNTLTGTAQTAYLEKISTDRKATIGDLDRAIQAGTWDVVVIQTYVDAKEPGKYEFFKYVDLLAKKFRASSPNARLVLYETWGSQKIPADQDAVSSNCYKAARMNNLILAPAGDAFRVARKERPELTIHRTADDDHPGLDGAYLAACAIFAAATETSPVNLPSNLWILPSYDFPYTVGTPDAM